VAAREQLITRRLRPVAQRNKSHNATTATEGASLFSCT
jgi:hypothetical protein